MGHGICFKEQNSRMLEYLHEARHLFQREEHPSFEYVHGARHLFQSEEQPSVGIRACVKVFVSTRRTAKC